MDAIEARARIIIGQAVAIAEQSEGLYSAMDIAPLVIRYGAELVALAMVPACMKGQDLGEFLAELCAVAE